MHSKANAQISGKEDQKPLLLAWHVDGPPLVFGVPIPEIAIIQVTIDMFSAPCKIASGRLMGLLADKITGKGGPFLKGI
jgi:hypothetical protein